MCDMSNLDSLDILAVGAHPDDVEVHVGGILAKAVKRGLRAAILDLTVGGLGTRGTAELRQAEALEAAKILGVERHFLDLPDARFTEGEDERIALMKAFRSLRPLVVVLPAFEDHHPDHRKAHRLGREAAYYSGLKNYPCPLEPWRPPTVAWVGGINPAAPPDIVIDVSEVWQQRMAAFDAFGSQFASEPDKPKTRIAHPAFRAGIEGRAMHWGSLILKSHAEGLWCEKPIPEGLLRLWSLLNKEGI
ncbi:MAG: bacillithiol biosynthesis deacetylase BshB1 [Holophagales bacterium]|jgi:bacillithiol biosynthesis deacetylase BshB1|nr:bacillithiol biosynthesis deacetylase BshB1 [Holophagales bacterium]